MNFLLFYCFKDNSSLFQVKRLYILLLFSLKIYILAVLLLFLLI